MDSHIIEKVKLIYHLCQGLEGLPEKQMSQNRQWQQHSADMDRRREAEKEDVGGSEEPSTSKYLEKWGPS